MCIYIYICVYNCNIIDVQVVPGRAGGGSFKRKKNYIAKKEFAYRMCARWPTIAMSKFFSEVWTKLLPLHGCHVMRFGVMCLWFDLLSNDVASCEVICGTTPTYYSSTTLYYKVLLRYYSVLQSTTPVLLSSTTTYYSVLQSTTKYYSSTTLYYKVLLQYYSPVLQSTTLYYKVLQSTTPVLLCTTKYYSSTTLYYKVLLQYYSVRQSTTPVLLCTTKYYSSTTLQYYNVLLCTTKYYKVLLQYYSVLQSTTPVLLCTTKYYSSTTLQYYKVLLCTTKYYASTTLYYASTTTYYSGTTLKRHLQCAAQQESASNFTKYCACHAKWMSSMICVTYETSFPMRGASQVTLQPHQILRLPRNLEAQDFIGNSLKCFRQ